MRSCVRQLVFLATAFCALLGAGSSTSSSLRQQPPALVEVAETPVEQTPVDGARWLSAMHAALDEATEIRMPFADGAELSRAAAAA